MATLSAAIPASDEALAVRRKWRWAAILLQVEALGALMVGAFYLIRSTATVSPMTALMGLVAASLLFPLATAIDRGNRGAGLVLAVLYSLRAFQLVMAPAGALVRMGPLLLLEGFVFGRAIIAMTKPGAPLPEPSTRRRILNLLITLLPLVAAAALFSQGAQRHQAAAIYKTREESLRIAHQLGWLLVLCGSALVFLHGLPSRILAAFGRAPLSPLSVSIPKIAVKLPWTLQVWMDFTIGIVTIVASLWTLDWMWDAMSAPGAMLVPGVLIFPLVALLCVPLGIVWIGIGIAEIKGKPWTMKLRIIAAIPLLLVAFFAIPMMGPFIVDFVLSMWAS